MRDLGTLAGYSSSAAAGINDRGEIIGTSYDASDEFANLNLTAFFWRNGKMNDLTELIVGDSPFDLLFFATGINDAGQIVGFGLTSTGDVHGFLATPRPGWAGDERAELETQSIKRPGVLPESARKLLRGGFGIRGR
jgi:probable HAF family extracellular repeat protein